MDRQTGRNSTMDTTRKDRIVRTVILVGGGLFILAMTYGSGMRAQVKKIQQINEQRKLAAQDFRDAQRKLRLRLAVATLLEARRQVVLALNELDQRNFGSAGEHLRTAVQLLQQVQTANTNTPDMARVISALQQINLTASVNVGEDRDRIQAVAAQMDASLNDLVPGFLHDAVADDNAHPIVAPTMNDVPLPPGNHIKD